MTDRDDTEMLAAEFVLGTLDAQTRESVARRRQDDPELDARILAWETRLAPLGDEVKPVSPDPLLLSRIERRIEAMEAASGGRTAPLAPKADASRVVTLRKRLRFWQWSAGLASAAALLLAAVLVAQPGLTPAQQSFVAVFQQNDQQPAFLLSVDLGNRQLHVQPVTAEPLSGKSYQLWIKEASLGPTPRSVGVLNDNLSLDPAALRDYDPTLLKRATFGISIEPPGGSPTGQPTGPAIHGYLYPADQAARRHHL